MNAPSRLGRRVLLAVAALVAVGYFLGYRNEAAFLSQTAGPGEDTGKQGHHYTNRLIREKSPYLLLHAHNPVDWYPWGEEAFAKARAISPRQQAPGILYARADAVLYLCLD